MKESLQELGGYIKQQWPQEVATCNVSKDELCVWVKRDNIAKFMSFLHDDANCHFHQLVDICAVDYPAREERFEVVYNMLSTALNQRIRVKLATDEATPVPTITHIYPAAGWFEREVWDMNGIFFSNNPDLRRILTDYGFDGHPLRKDFPLSGYVEMRYDEEQKRVIYDPVKLPQAFRSFDYLSPWEGPDEYILPGDEKAQGKDSGEAA